MPSPPRSSRTGQGPASGAQTRPKSAVGRLLALLTRLGDAEHIATFLAEVVAAGASTLGDNPAIVAALGQLPPQQRGGVLGRIIAGVAETAFGRAANLLARAASTPGLGDLHAAARSLLSALPGEPTQQAGPADWSAAGEARRWSSICCRRSAGSTTAWRNRRWKRCCCGPRATTSTRRWCRRRGPCSTGRWCGHCRRSRGCATRACAIFERGSPNRWRRPPTGGGRARCAARARCAGSWRRFSTIRGSGRGACAPPPTSALMWSRAFARCNAMWTPTPRRAAGLYTLVCRKNQASYERRAKQRQEDLAAVAALGG